MEYSKENRLSRAAKHGDFETTLNSLLTRADCDVNAADDDGYTALMWAVKKVVRASDDHGQMIAELLKHPQIDVNASYPPYRRTALHIACGSGMKRRLRADRRHPASSHGVRMLIADKRCDVNAEDICNHL